MILEDARREKGLATGGRPYRASRLERSVNFGLAALLLAFLSPLFLLVAALIKLDDGGPVFFRQARIGRGGKTFRCLKFRSMAVDAEARLIQLLATDATARSEWEQDQKLRKDPRITPIGAFLRASSLDELPQLINVVRGEMNLVGPRPIVSAETVRYGRYLSAYCAVRPGITGLWQVSGRNDVSYRRRVAMDTLYSRSKCISLDARILVMTLPAVLLRRGSY